MYNVHHAGYPDNLPPPPNPDKLLQFYFKCIEETISQKNRENSPDAGASDGNAVHNRRPATP